MSEFPPPFRGDMTLDEARELLRELVKVGHTCPACTQLAKVYRRRLNAGIARALISLYKAGAWEHFVHKPTALKGLGAAARDESISRYWGLMVEETSRRPDGGRKGWWKLTPLGVSFVQGIESVPSHALIYDSKLLRLDGDPMTIREALGKGFDYDELMRGI